MALVCGRWSAGNSRLSLTSFKSQWLDEMSAGRKVQGISIQRALNIVGLAPCSGKVASSTAFGAWRAQDKPHADWIPKWPKSKLLNAMLMVCWTFVKIHSR